MHQLLLAHFQTKHGNGMATSRGIFHHVQRERGLAHAGPRRQHDHFALLQAAGDLVKFREAGGHSIE